MYILYIHFFNEFQGDLFYEKYIFTPFIHSENATDNKRFWTNALMSANIRHTDHITWIWAQSDEHRHMEM